MAQKIGYHLWMAPNYLLQIILNSLDIHAQDHKTLTGPALMVVLHQSKFRTFKILFTLIWWQFPKTPLNVNLIFLKYEKNVYFNWKEALLIKREENVLILRRLRTCFQKRRKCTKFKKLIYIFSIRKKNLGRWEEFKKKLYILLKSHFIFQLFLTSKL